MAFKYHDNFIVFWVNLTNDLILFFVNLKRNYQKQEKVSIVIKIISFQTFALYRSVYMCYCVKY